MKVNYEVIEESIGDSGFRLLQRACVEVSDDASLFGIGRQIKKKIGWAGRHCRVIAFENGQEIRVYGAQLVARFVIASDPPVKPSLDNAFPNEIRLVSDYLK